MINLKDIQYDDTYLSLTKLIGKQIKDIKCYVTMEFGEPTIKVSWLVFDDNTELSFEGEHDLPYLVEVHDQQPNFNTETLEDIYNQENPDDL